MLNDDYIPIAQSGLQIVGVPLGTHQFCQQQLQKTILSIKADLDLLKILTFSTNVSNSHFTVATQGPLIYFMQCPL